jgi:hypothetical protein
MKKALKYGFVVSIIVLIGIQFFPAQHDEPLAFTESDFIAYYQPSPEISKLLRVSCYDCHSNQTKYPWYSYVQPAGWILQEHVDEGKAELNFSNFGKLSSRMKRTKLKSMASQIENDEMPLTSYTLIHRDAVLSKKDKKTLTDYLTSLVDD